MESISSFTDVFETSSSENLYKAAQGLQNSVAAVGLESTPFLSVDGQSISLMQALQYLRISGKLQGFLWEILRQHIIVEQLRKRDDLEINSAEFEQAIINFRLENQLADATSFENWLTRSGLDTEAFHHLAVYRFKLDKLKAKVTQQNLQTYFAQQQHLLAEIAFSGFAVANQELAEQLANRITSTNMNFEQLAKEYAAMGEQSVQPISGTTRLAQIPEQFRTPMQAAQPGELVGPLAIGERWYLFRVERVVPAVLEGKLKQELQNQLFEKWLLDKVQTMQVSLEVNASDQ
jgi:parvulin-like peptidyl-prolyl isomerase